MNKSLDKKHLAQQWDRRDFLRFGLTVTASGLILPSGFSTLPKPAQAADTSLKKNGKFVLHVHVGSWDGWHGGLLMPNKAGEFPKGIFVTGQQVLSPNPNCNDHATVGSHILTGYTRVLEPIAKNALFSVITPQSLTHTVGDMIQCTGSPVVGTAGLPSWAMGFAHRMAELSGVPTAFVVDASDSCVSQRGRQATKATQISTSDVAGFAMSRSDSVGVEGSGSNHAGMMKNFSDTHPLGIGGANWSGAAREYAKVMSTFAAPQAVAVDSPAVAEINTHINATAIQNIFSSLDEKAALGPDNYLLSNFQLAAALIETGEGSGMGVRYGNTDMHGGGSSADTARLGTTLFGHIRCFWEWVVSKGYQNDVLVIVTQEFSRSPWNANMAKRQVVFKGATVDIDAPGTEHHLIGGIFALHGSFTDGARLGSVGDGNIALAGTDLKGTSSQVAVPHTSTDVVGSLMMRCFPKEFPTDLEVHNTWFNFRIENVIKPLTQG